MKKTVCSMRLKLSLALVLMSVFQASIAASPSLPKQDVYANPIIHADYSDPDVIRVGDRYYMTASSFNLAPGLPLLQSTDMVNWHLTGYAFEQQTPAENFIKPQHGKGVWAPCLRYHDGMFWIFYPDPDTGIYMITAKDFNGPWSKPHLLLAGKGLIDPSPLWDEDGNAYLIHAWAKSRAGINNRITLRKMSGDGRQIMDQEGMVIIDGDKLHGYTTLEGPKLYKYQGYYYIFAPAGGVEHGWQSVFRAKSITGPYEDKIVLHQGKTNINGPHQGAWVQTAEGKDWFYHFQDKRAYGRIVHLQPMQWKDGWPQMGQDINEQGIGEPVSMYARPLSGARDTIRQVSDDEFSLKKLDLVWQWNANWEASWYSLSARPGHLRLFSQPGQETGDNLWHAPAILLQKLPATSFVVDSSFDIRHLADGDSAGLLMYGMDYAWLGVMRQQNGASLVMVTCHQADAGSLEKPEASQILKQHIVYLRMEVGDGGLTQFSYSLNRKDYSKLGPAFTARMGRWVGASMGLFSTAKNRGEKASGYVDIDYFKVKVLP